MNQLVTNSEINLDDRLADFTNQVMEGKIQESGSEINSELSRLEETILRLRSSLPPITMDGALVKQMHIRFKSRLRQTDIKPEPSLWRQWLEILQDRPQLSMVAGIMSLFLIFFILTPILTPAAPSITATALTPPEGTTMFLGLALAAVIIILWVKRRK